VRARGGEREEGYTTPTTAMRTTGDLPPPFVTLPLRDTENSTRPDAATSARAFEPEPAVSLVSWNIGLRGLRRLADSTRPADKVAAKDEHGVQRQLGYGSMAALLSSLGEDVRVVCLQETKLTGRSDLTDDLACPPGWDSAFSVCRRVERGKSGYAGVATYFRSGMRVDGAEEGVTGILAEDAETFEEGIVPRATSSASKMGFVGHHGSIREKFTRSRRAELDAEGRCVLVDFHGFVLFNLYVPAITSSDASEAESRAAYKRDFLDAVAARSYALREAGRRVVLCGDWNVSPRAIDSADARYVTTRAEEVRFITRDPFRSRIARLSGNVGIFSPAGAPPASASAASLESSPDALPPLVDVFRSTYPRLVGAYTCWNVAAGAQLTNHGSRLDYFLVDDSLAGYVSRSGIAQTHPGSDHCPVFIALRPQAFGDFRGSRDGTRSAESHANPPPALLSSVALATAGRQARLTGFYRKGGPSPPLAAPPDRRRDAGAAADAKRQGDVSVRSCFKRAGGVSGGVSGNDEKRFRTTATATTATTTVTTSAAPTPAPSGTERFLFSHAATASKETVDAWRRIRELQKPPRCRGHGEVAKVRKVMKSGPNFGRVFFACPRPSGDSANGGDCGFFQWAYDRKEQTSAASREA